MALHNVLFFGSIYPLDPKLVIHLSSLRDLN